jgi:hypothetical protein
MPESPARVNTLQDFLLFDTSDSQICDDYIFVSDYDKVEITILHILLYSVIFLKNAGFFHFYQKNTNK